MAVDYSPHDFRRSFEVINHAAQSGVPAASYYADGGVHMRQEGDTTVMTEHRDPYSFYWQLDKLRRRSPSPPREPPMPQLENAIEEMVDESSQVESPDSHDSGVQVEYARPSKPVKKMTAEWERPVPEPEKLVKRHVPVDWDEDPRVYSNYWHVDAEVVPREPPPVSAERPPTPPSPIIERVVERVERPPVVVERRIVEQPQPPAQPIIVERAFKQITTKRRVEADQSEDHEENQSGMPARFAVRSLGWTEIPEEELTPERSSRAVNKAINDLSTGRNDMIDNVAKWGDGKELILELDNEDLRLIDPDNEIVLHSQPVHQIRVWGVGRENGRDFAYVARDRHTRRLMCHVFRCDTPARTIANTLRDVCKRLMMERQGVSQGGAEEEKTVRKVQESGRGDGGQQLQRHHSDRTSSKHQSFPTPTEEPRKVIRAHFIGVTQVPKATGMDVLNEAMGRLVSQVRPERWILADVAISPSAIAIQEVGGNQIAECRIRYLSFLGIGGDVKHCAFIVQTAQDNYMCYVFHVEPSAGALAKTIEAACKLRYQKVLDANYSERRYSGDSNKGWGDTIRDVFGGRRSQRSQRSSNNY